MLTTLLLLVLATVLFAPPIILAKSEDWLTWSARYFLSVLPVGYTFLGWQVGALGYEYFACQGNPKGFHDCINWGMDFTPLVGHGLFLMIPCLFFALPVSLWLVISTASKQIGGWHKRSFPNSASSDD